jgi:hypothetical protein
LNLKISSEEPKIVKSPEVSFSTYNKAEEENNFSDLSEHSGSAGDSKCN